MRVSAWALLVLLGAAAAAAPAQERPAGQSIFQRLSLDRLQLTALGVSAGPVKPGRVEATEAFGLHADYGEVAHNWRVVFSATYWGSQFRRDILREFERQLRASVIDPADDDTLRIGRITISDIALEAEVRFAPRDRRRLRPYVGGGIGAHVINAEGEVIAHTFVESALDNIATGFSAVAGTDLAVSRGLTVGVLARYTLLSNVRFGTVRGVVTYTFNTGTRPTTPTAAPTPPATPPATPP